MASHMSDSPIEFFYDLVSPYSHFAAHTIDALAERTGRSVRWRAFFLGGVLRSTGNQAPGTVPAKGRYLAADFRRESARLGVPFQFHPGFPMNTLTLMRGLSALEERQPAVLPGLVPDLFSALWVENREATDLSAFADVFAHHGVDPAQFAADAADPRNKQRLKDASDEAVARGAFGAPTFFVDERMWWGHDRMGQLAWWLEGANPPDAT